MGGASFDAVIVAGGAAKRLGGADKAGVVVGGRTLLDRVRAAVSAAGRVVVVGPQVDGGPVSALADGLEQVDGDVLVVLACDLPLVTPDTVERLVAGLLAGPDTADVAVLTDDEGRQQFLAAAYRRTPLRDAVHALGSPHGRSMRRVLQDLRVREVPAHPDEAMDCDTWDDVHRAARLLEDR